MYTHLSFFGGTALLFVCGAAHIGARAECVYVTP
jgi:hypothetical protein